MSDIGVAIHNVGIKVRSWSASLHVNEPTSIGIRDAVEKLGTITLKNRERRKKLAITKNILLFNRTD